MVRGSLLVNSRNPDLWREEVRLQSAQKASIHQENLDHVDHVDRVDQVASSQEACFGQHSITLGLLTAPGNHAEVFFRAPLHHFWLIWVITATCQSLFWNNTPSLWTDFGDHRNMPKSVLEQHSITVGSFW